MLFFTVGPFIGYRIAWTMAWTRHRRACRYALDVRIQDNETLDVDDRTTYHESTTTDNYLSAEPDRSADMVGDPVLRESQESLPAPPRSRDSAPLVRRESSLASMSKDRTCQSYAGGPLEPAVLQEPGFRLVKRRAIDGVEFRLNQTL